MEHVTRNGHSNNTYAAFYSPERQISIARSKSPLDSMWALSACRYLKPIFVSLLSRPSFCCSAYHKAIQDRVERSATHDFLLPHPNSETLIGHTWRTLDSANAICVNSHTYTRTYIHASTSVLYIVTARQSTLLLANVWNVIRCMVVS